MGQIRNFALCALITAVSSGVGLWASDAHARSATTLTGGTCTASPTDPGTIKCCKGDTCNWCKKVDGEQSCIDGIKTRISGSSTGILSGSTSFTTLQTAPTTTTTTTKTSIISPKTSIRR